MKRNAVFHLSNAPLALPVICLCIILPSHAADFEPGGFSTDVVMSFGEPVTTTSMSTTLTSTTSTTSSSTTGTSSSTTTFQLDFGDAPFSLVTLEVDDGARHVILSHYFMGAGVDAETNGLPSANADGDDFDGVGNDEDGWLLADVLYPGNAGEFGVTVSSNGYIQGWLDFNQDGQWQEGVEHIFSNRFVMAGATNLQFFVPVSSTSGATFARFRLSSIPGIGVTGLAPDGEVEDHAVFVEPPRWDYGDAPDFGTEYRYPTLFASDGARHLVVDDVHLGSDIDPDDDGQPTGFFADGDDTDEDGDDEDGIVFQTPLFSGSNAQFSVTASVDGYLQMWVDYNADTDWEDEGESVFVDRFLFSGSSNITFLIPDNIDGLTFVRFRFSTEPGFSFFGDAPDGEVEDYAITIYHPQTDYGDAPESGTSFQTLLLNDAARHRIGVGFLGSSVDAELDGQPAILADLDDVTGLPDDEDGVMFLTHLVPGVDSRIEVVTSGPGTLNAWIDFEGNGDWNDVSDQIVEDHVLVGSSDIVTFPVPPGAVPGLTYARFRFSSFDGVEPFGLVLNGEVEDYLVRIVELDYGDAPFLDVTLNDTNGAHHVVTPGIQLGASIDAETNGQASAFADGDDNDLEGDDEDGISFIDSLLPGQAARIGVSPSTSGILQGWMDFDGDSSWEAGAEHVISNVSVTTNTTSVLINVPGSVIPSGSIARFRFSTAIDIPVAGSAPDGEVEDYLVFFEAPSWDMGDAPGTLGSGFPTLLALDGARHAIVSNVMLGSIIDADLDGQPNGTAGGDDIDGTNDEDGVVFITPLLVGSGAVIQVSVSTGGYFQGWFDYDLDGEWEAHEEEQVFSNQFINPGITNLDFFVPLPAIPGETFARFRFSTVSNIDIVGYAPDGEVEDYLVDIGARNFDFGDAPFAYPTSIVKDGARHELDPFVYMGSVVDEELDGQPTPAADGDDTDGNGDDEDGVTFLTPLVPGLDAGIRVGVPVDGYLQTWADFDQNASWDDAGEQVFDDLYLSVGEHVLTFPVPGSATVGPLYMRFRFATAQGVEVRGLAIDGEVEDYRVVVSSAPVSTSSNRCPTWIQSADILHGIDIESWLIQLTEERREIRLADDWLSDGRSVKALRWWGSYLGWQGAPGDVPLEVRPLGFRLTLYASLSTNESGEAFIMPGVELTHAIVPYNAVSETLYSISDLSFVETNAFEYEFEYYAELDTPWSVTEGETYWLGFEAVYSSFFFSYRWGWCTAPLSEGYGEQATLRKRSDLNWSAMTYPPDVVSWRDITNHPSQGDIIDQAFEVLTAHCPRRDAQWAQDSDDAAAHALASSHDQQQNIVRADDFEGDGGRIIDFDWRGSYPGWRDSEFGSVTNPVTPPGGPDGPIGFMLTLLDEDGAACLPGLVRTSAFVLMEHCNQSYSASSIQNWLGGNPVMQQYAYSVDLSDASISTDPWQTEAGSNYWLSIQAVFESSSVSTSHQGWAWQVAVDTQLCGSTVSVNGGVSWAGAALIAPHPRQGESFDFVFSIVTDEILPGPLATEPEVIGIWFLASDVVIESLGEGGLGSHVLQYSTNLFEDFWMDLAEDPLPLAAPLTNFWYLPAPPGSNIFFRIQQR